MLRGLISKTVLRGEAGKPIAIFKGEGHRSVFVALHTLFAAGPGASLSFVLSDEARIEHEIAMQPDQIRSARLYSCEVAGALTRNNAVSEEPRPEIQGDAEWSSVERVVKFFISCIERQLLVLDLSDGHSMQFLPMLTPDAFAMDEMIPLSMVLAQEHPWKMHLNVRVRGEGEPTGSLDRSYLG